MKRSQERLRVPSYLVVRRRCSSFSTDPASHGLGGATSSSAMWNAARRLTSSTVSLHSSLQLVGRAQQSRFSPSRTDADGRRDLVHRQVEIEVEYEYQTLVLVHRPQSLAQLDSRHDRFVLRIGDRLGLVEAGDGL